MDVNGQSAIQKIIRKKHLTKNSNDKSKNKYFNIN